MSREHRLVLIMSGTWACLTMGSATAADFDRDIRPILAAHCFSCHGPTKQRGGLRLDRKADALRGSDSGPAIVVGKSAASLLLKKLTSADPQERMPPDADPLTSQQIKSIKDWIDQGANWNETEKAVTDHWSFRPVVRPTPPSVNRSDWPRNPIDHFILARLEKASLTPSQAADRSTLIRRIKFDLLGLPPTPEEIEAFVNDPAKDAYEKLVERYLASPHYGERWARHWLDVVRFAESAGFETNLNRPNAWPYRDYVIRALNNDFPYDRFITEQLAGDALGNDTATGFLVAGANDIVKSPDVVLTRQQRADELHDMVATTTSTFLGLTVGCARCHHHKFDPVSQRDYHAIKAIFAGVQHGERPVESSNEQRERLAKVEGLRQEIAKLDRELIDAEPLARPAGPADRRKPVNPRKNIERFTPVTAKFIRFTVEATTDLEPCIDELEVFTPGTSPRNVALTSNGAKATTSGTYPGAAIHKLEHINDGRYGNSRSWISNEHGKGWVQLEFPEAVAIDCIVWGRDRDGKFRDRLAVRYKIEAATDPDHWTVIATSEDRQPYSATQRGSPNLMEARRTKVEQRLHESERPPMVYAGMFTKPEPIQRLHRGEPMQPREAVAPGGLTSIGPKLELADNVTDRERRLAFAKWVTDPAHPLTSRVMVNRIWHYHIGRGLVETPGDFGHNGASPTHPELLDWLAAEFVSHGWSIKHIHRLIVSSATYRQSGAADPKGMVADAQSRLLWRYPPRRLEAEVIRDAILSVSGVLDTRKGGPGFDLFEPNSNYVKVYTPKQKFGPAEFRRMIYQSRPRMQPDDTFGAFDCPDGGQIAPRRNVSTTPLQALNLLNSPFMVQQSELLAARVKREAGDDPAAQVRRGFRLAFGRNATVQEIDSATKLINDHGLAAFGRALINANEFLFVE